MRNGTSPTRGGSLARSCFRGGCEPGLLPRLCDTASQEEGVPLPEVSAPTLVDGRGEQQCSKEGGGESALHEGVQDIGWGRMSQTYCASVRDRSEDLLKIRHTDGFKLNGVGALQTRACRGMEVEIL